MSNFFRAVRIALQYRWTLAGIVLSSLLVALCWGANIGAVYPVINVVFQRDSMQNWVQQHVREAKATTQTAHQALAEERARRAEQESGILPWMAEQRLALRQRALNTWDRAVRGIEAITPWLPDQPFQSLLWVVAFLGLGTLLKCIFLVFNLMLVARLSQLATLELRNLFFRSTLKMELSAFDQGGTGALISRFTNDLAAITGGVSTLFGKTLREPAKMVVCLAGAALISWRLLLFSMVIAPAAFCLMYLLAKSIKRANRRAMEEMGQIYNRLSESFHGIKVVKAFTMERLERSRFFQTAKELYLKTMRVAFYSALTRFNNELLGVGVLCLALLAGGYLVLSGETTVLGIPLTSQPISFPVMMLFFGFLVGISDPARKLADVFNQLQRGAAAADRVYSLIDREPAIDDPANPIPLTNVAAADLVFENVHFHYSPHTPILKDINLHVRAGETIALVGPNGCGKSTLASLLLRFYDPAAGTIRLGDTSLRDVRLRELRQNIGLVTQQTLLFDDTIANNIRYGSPHATDEQVMEAAKKAHAHRFITEQLQEGYQSEVGERGDRLSGGQRQRIALARAILRNPAIIILDEATSQIDQESERLIHQALKTFLTGRTALIITHRSSTISLADRVLVMSEGRILDFDTHDQVLQRCPLYQQLYQGDLRKSA